MNGRIMCSAGMVCFFFNNPCLGTDADTDTNPNANTKKPVVDTDSIVSNIQSQLKLTQVQAEKITPIIDEENQKLSKILTADQMNQWLNLLNQIHQKHKKSKHSAASASPGSENLRCPANEGQRFYINIINFNGDLNF